MHTNMSILYKTCFHCSKVYCWNFFFSFLLQGLASRWPVWVVLTEDLIGCLTQTQSIALVVQRGSPGGSGDTTAETVGRYVLCLGVGHAHCVVVLGVYGVHVWAGYLVELRGCFLWLCVCQLVNFPHPTL